MRKTTKIFSLIIRGSNPVGVVVKVGEVPAFGPPTPPRVFKLIGEEYRELFLQGRRAENKGFRWFPFPASLPSLGMSSWVLRWRKTGTRRD
jgi:hypothetical protein